MVAFGAVCEFLLPFLIVSRDPERVLEVLLPTFRMISRPLSPITYGLLHLLNHSTPRADCAGVGEPRRSQRRWRSDHGAPASETTASRASGRAQAAEVDRRLWGHAGSRGHDAAARHRRDQADATLDDLRALFREQEYSRIPVFRDNLDNILGFVYVKDLILLGDSPKGDAADHATTFVRHTSSRRPSS